MPEKFIPKVEQDDNYWISESDSLNPEVLAEQAAADQQAETDQAFRNQLKVEEIMADLAANDDNYADPTMEQGDPVGAKSDLREAA